MTKTKLFAGRLALPALIGAAVAMAGAAAAQDVASPPSTTVVVAWGQILADHTGEIATALLGLVLYMIRRLPPELAAMLATRRVEQLLAQAIAFGCNAVAGASRDRVLSVDVGSAVLAEALRYTLGHGPGWLVRWMGGPNAIVEKLWSRLDLDPAARLPDLAAIAAQVAATHERSRPAR